MAIYRLEAKLLNRQAKDVAGRPIAGKQVSIVAKAAYRSGERLHDERTAQTYDYRSRTQEVAYSAILAPEHSPSWLQGQNLTEKRQRLWNEVEKVEKRKDSQLAREFIISLPRELSKDQQAEAVKSWCTHEFVERGFIVDFSLHNSKDKANPHAHVLCTLRPCEGEGFGLKPNTAGKFNGRGTVGQGAKNELEAWRESWEVAANEALEQAGSEARIDHRSLKDQGIEDHMPEPKIGVAAIHMQRSGRVPDPERVRHTRRVRVFNAVLPSIREVEGSGEIAQEGLGVPWQERAGGLLNRMYDRALEFVKDESSGGRLWGERIGKKREVEPDISR